MEQILSKRTNNRFKGLIDVTEALRQMEAVGPLGQGHEWHEFCWLYCGRERGAF